MQHSRVSCIRPPHPTPPKHTRTHTSQRSAALTLVPAAFGVLSTALTSGEYRVAKGHNPLTMRAHANNTLSQTPVSGFPQAARPHSWEEDAPEYDCSLGSRRPNPFQSVTAASWKRIGGWGGGQGGYNGGKTRLALGHRRARAHTCLLGTVSLPECSQKGRERNNNDLLFRTKNIKLVWLLFGGLKKGWIWGGSGADQAVP